MSSSQINSSRSIEELIGNLSKLDTPTLNYLITSLCKIQVSREEGEGIVAMNEKKFWKLIDTINWKKDKKKTTITPLINELSQDSIAAIFQFAERLAFLLHQLDGPAYTVPLEQTDAGFSADTFLYARCLTVAKGKDFYYQVLNHPSSFPTHTDFEDLLYVAKQAYEQKTKVPYSYVPTINYESFFNKALWGAKAITL